jgi:hypothetical protein
VTKGGSNFASSEEALELARAVILLLCKAEEVLSVYVQVPRRGPYNPAADQFSR